MLGKFFECEANRNDKYYRVIQTEKEYSDGRRFPIDEIVIADNKVDLNAEDRTKLGGFCISSYSAGLPFGSDGLTATVAFSAAALESAAI